MDLRSASQDFAWVSENLVELQKQYPGKFVAVANRKVIASADNWEDADRRARQVLDREATFILEYIESGDLYAFVIPLSTQTITRN